MKTRQKRLMLVGFGLAALLAITALVLNAFSDNLVFFHTPSEIASNSVPLERTFRLGGLVEDNSVRRGEDGVTVHFKVTDTAKAVPVIYSGVLPNLFREGQGVVTVGQLQEDGVFRATQVMARHDEEYMPPEAAEAIKQAQRERARTVERPEGL
ncbi:cytochrome c maturation protein CcmE [Thioalkalivibrio sp. ALJT]|uniref:cytochrome c maturation protein CcmE n=1 Tax=Thioalkalivibrio sp. ALJT TaxID=1158146 RepID=UPI00037B2974|nr:cytochrome c maturation protein CcmE [Thioalkalivibrio sp. ALJT]